MNLFEMKKMLKKRYIFLIVIICLFTLTTANAVDNTTIGTSNVNDANEIINLNDDTVTDNNLENDNVNNKDILGSIESQEDNLTYDENTSKTSHLSYYKTYPTYSDYSVTLSDTTFYYDVGGLIYIDISPSRDSEYKYDYTLKIYDSNNNMQISYSYYDKVNSYSRTYNVTPYKLNPGTYTMKIINNYDDVVMDTADLIVTIKSKIFVPNLIKYYGGSERLIITLTDTSNTPLSGQLINITLNDVKYERTTNIDGVASLGVNLNSGYYYVTIQHGLSKATSSVTIKNTISSNDFSKIFKNGTQYYATFLDSNGNFLKNTDVKFNINGIFYTRKTNNQGTAKLNINLGPNTYVLTATNPVTGEKHSSKIKVLPNIVNNYDLTKYYKNNSQYRVQLLDDTGDPVDSGVSVSFNINGVFYERFTDSYGYAKMNINLGEGRYIITADYKGFKVSNTIEVLPILSASDVSMEYGDGSQFKVKLVDGTGNPYANQVVTLNINGVFYNRTTDDNGVAKLNIRLSPDRYIITSSFNGFNIANKIAISPKVTPSDSGSSGNSSKSDGSSPENNIILINIGNNQRKIEKVGNYEIDVETFDTPSITTTSIVLKYNNNVLKQDSFYARVYYKQDGVWRWSSWSKGGNDNYGGTAYKFSTWGHSDISKVEIDII